MLNNVRASITQYNMLQGAKGVLVAFSGGADSCALLHALRALLPEYGFTLRALHVNHGIRGEEAKRDEDFCRRFCETLGVPLTVRSFDIPAIAKEQGIGLEEAGRKMRYAAFDEECEKYALDRIATAHHADDNLETLLFYLTRGCGLGGLCGIPPVRGNIIRPLIHCSREDILNYCAENGIGYVTDSTNTDETYTRNYIRANIVPALKKLDPNVPKTVAHTCDLLREDRALLDASALDGVTSRASLSSLPDAILSRHIIRLCPDDCSPEKTHIVAAMNALRSGGEKFVSFPKEYTFVCEGDNISFIKGKKTANDTPPSYDVHLDKDIIILEGGIAVGEVSASEPYGTDPDFRKSYNLSIYQSINFDKIKGNIRVRTRKENDMYLLGGIHRSVKKLMQSRGISGKARARLPYFCDDDGIVWIPGFPPRDGAEGTDKGFSYYILKEIQK